MQAASCLVQPLFPSKSTFSLKQTILLTTSRSSSVKAASVVFEPLAVNYNSPFSVFPAEACETVGGDACAANMYPEVKLNKPEMKGYKRTVFEQFEREYFDYNSEAKSVLKGEACDDLGGEFCEAPYMRGVY